MRKYLIEVTEKIVSRWTVMADNENEIDDVFDEITAEFVDESEYPKRIEFVREIKI